MLEMELLSYLETNSNVVYQQCLDFKRNSNRLEQPIQNWKCLINSFENDFTYIMRRFKDIGMVNRRRNQVVRIYQILETYKRLEDIFIAKELDHVCGIYKFT